MKKYSLVERTVSHALRRVPRLHRLAKLVYSWLNAAFFARSDFIVSVSPGTKLLTPSRVLGGDGPSADEAEFFGYFDVSPWSSCQRYYATHRLKKGAKSVDIHVYDAQSGCGQSLARTPAWTLQQGAMTRWVKTVEGEQLAFNDVQGNVLGTTFMSSDGAVKRFCPMPLEAYNAAHSCYYSLNFQRLYLNGTEYGYMLNCENFPSDLPYREDGIWLCPLPVFDASSRGQASLVTSLQELIDARSRPDMRGAVHEVNHIQVSPDGENMVFVHRWRGPSGQFSRLYMCRYDGSALRLLSDDNVVSHFCWLDAETLLSWQRTKDHGSGYHLIDVASGTIKPAPQKELFDLPDGHPTYCSDKMSIVTDTYADRKREQTVYCVDRQSYSVQELGRFKLPMEFFGDRRIDLHPRWSPDGFNLSIDAGFEGVRRNYILTLEPSLTQKNHQKNSKYEMGD